MFFNNVVPERCLKELQMVELVFPPYSHDGWPDEGALEDWSHSLSWARKKLNLPALTLRLIMTGLHAAENPDDREHMTEEQGKRIIASYASIVAPLACLGSDGLAKFHAQFAWPWAYTRESEAMRDWHGWKWVANKVKILSENYGRLIMGDRYDSLYSGGGEPTDSVWVRKYISIF